MTPDNDIRIPSTNYLQPFVDELTELYACKANPQECPAIPEEGLSPRAFKIYSEALTTIRQVVSGTPLLRERFDAPEIATHSSATLLDGTQLILQNSCEAGIPAVLPRLHDALYWSERAGINDAELSPRLLSISQEFQKCWEISAGVSVLERIYVVGTLSSIFKLNNYPSTYYSASRDHGLALKSMLTGISTLLLSPDFDANLEETAQNQWAVYEAIDVLISAPFPRKSAFTLMAEEAKKIPQDYPDFPLSVDEMDRRLELIHRRLKERKQELKGE